MRVGRLGTSSDIHRKSDKASWTPVGSVILLPLTWQMASCNWINSSLAPGRAGAIKDSFPRTQCHLSTPTLRWERYMEETISLSHTTRWGGRVIVIMIESKIHPNMVWHVKHEQSPASSFLSKRNSLRCLVSYRSRVRNTLSSAWKSVRRTWWWRCHGPCPIPRKLSKNTQSCTHLRKQSADIFYKTRIRVNCHGM